MALNALGLGFLFTAQDLASGKINNIARSFGGMDRAAVAASTSMQRNFAQLGAGVAIMGAGMLALGGGFGLANMSSEFSTELARVGGVAQATTEELGQLRNAAIEAGRDTRFSPTEAMQGLGELAQAGMNATQSIQSLQGVLALSTGGQIEVAQSAASISAALRVFRMESSQAGEVADMFLRISNSTSLAAGDMEQAMGSVARGAISTRQELTEMLPAIGLVKNTGVDVSVAAQSVSSALVFMSSRADAFRGIGVEITNADGSFRDFMDVVLETGQVLERDYPNAAERTAKATELFSRFGLQAYTGVQQQLAQGVRDSTGRLYQGAEAIQFLRFQMESSAGAAQEFTDRMNATFEGRKALLTSALTTLGILVGEGFEEALKPMITAITGVVRWITNVVNEMPVGLRQAIATFILFAGAVTTAFGVFIAGKAIFALLAPFIGSITTAFVGLLASLVPLALAFGAVLAVGYAFNRYLSQNEGAAAGVARAVNMVVLGFRGLFQLVSTGRLSGGILADLNRVENQGLKRFLAQVVAFGFRIMQFFRGIKIGFDAAIDTMGPTIDRLIGTFSQLWSYVSSIFGGSGESLIAGSSARYAEWGASVGNFLGRVVEVLAQLIEGVGRFAIGFIGGFRTVMNYFKPVFDDLKKAFGELWTSITSIGDGIQLFGGTMADGAGGIELFGNAAGGVAGGGVALLARALRFVVDVLRVIIDVLGFAIRKVVQFLDFFFDAGVAVGHNLEMAKFKVLDLVDSTIIGIGNMMSAIPPSLRPQFADDAIAAGREAETRKDRRIFDRIDANERRDRLQNVVNVGGPSEAQARGEGASAAAASQVSQQIAALLSRQRTERQNQIINLQVDGETIATAMTNAAENGAERSFTPRGGG